MSTPQLPAGLPAQWNEHKARRFVAGDNTALIWAFDWDSTPQGAIYWNDIDDGKGDYEEGRRIVRNWLPMTEPAKESEAVALVRKLEEGLRRLVVCLDADADPRLAESPLITPSSPLGIARARLTEAAAFLAKEETK